MKKITIIGGDLRIAKLAELLAEDGFLIKTFALDKAENLNKLETIKKCSSMEEAIEGAELVIGPIPLSSNGKDINTPFSDTCITVEELFSKLDGKKVIVGNLKEFSEEYIIVDDKKIEKISCADHVGIDLSEAVCNKLNEVIDIVNKLQKPGD